MVSWHVDIELQGHQEEVAGTSKDGVKWALNGRATRLPLLGPIDLLADGQLSI